MRKFTSYIILLFLAFQIQIFSQTSKEIENKNENLVLIVKNDGGEFIGKIISDDGREILVVTKAIGKIFINKSDISSITKVDEGLENKENKENKEFRASGPFTTRYYFTTNALPIKKNDNYGLIHLYGPEIHLSVGNKTSIGLMATWIASPIALVLKQQIYSNNNFHVSIGSIIGSSGYINQGQTYGGLHWGTMTIGNRLSNFSFSAGLAHINWTENITNYYDNNVFMSSARDMGDKNSYSFYDSDHPYYIPPVNVGNSNFESDFQNTVDGGLTSYDRRFYKSKQLASVIGFSGIVPFGKKASFIFDSMLFIANKSKLTYTSKEIDVTYTYDTNDPATGILTPQTETQTVIYGEGSIGSETSRSTTFIFMPAMRFNQSYTSSFQVALAGFINKNENGSTSSPIPMISWLRKF